MAERVDKITWSGTLVAIQPRIRLLRSFDQRDHAYLGYSLRVDGIMCEGRCEFTVGIGKATQAAHGLRAGDIVEGLCSPVPNPELEPVEFYKVSKFRVRIRGTETPLNSPPWGGQPPALEVYRERGHRRLAPQTYDANCMACIWGCRMAVEMIIDHWNPSQRRYRHETFCYRK